MKVIHSTLKPSSLATLWLLVLMSTPGVGGQHREGALNPSRPAVFLFDPEGQILG